MTAIAFFPSFLTVSTMSLPKSPLGMIGRTGVLAVLAAVTVLAPLGTRVGFLSLAVTPAVAAQTGATADVFV